jgi:glycerol uptake facilitator-like aquaporin
LIFVPALTGNHLTDILLPLSTVPASNINNAQAVFIEMFITAALCLAVLMLAAEKHSSTPFAPVSVTITAQKMKCLFFAPLLPPFTRTFVDTDF